MIAKTRKYQKGRPKKLKRLNSNKGGRKQIDLENSSLSTVYRRAHKLLDQNDISLLKLAINIHEKKTKVESNNTDANSLRHTKDTALAFYLDNDYSKNKYVALVKDSRSRGCNTYPCYEILHEEMLMCHVNNCKSSENEVIIPLQSLLNKSAERLCESVALDWNERDLKNLRLTATLGFDSSAGHLNPQQGYENTTNECSESHQHLFITCALIIQLISRTNGKYNND